MDYEIDQEARMYGVALETERSKREAAEKDRDEYRIWWTEERSRRLVAEEDLEVTRTALLKIMSLIQGALNESG